MQLNHMHPGESLAYLKILDNIAVVVDHEQVEKATVGHWRDNIVEIVNKIVQYQGILLFLKCPSKPLTAI